MTPQGPKSCLSELKCINAAKTWYPRGDVTLKGTERRARLLTNEYEAKLRKYDVRYHGAVPNMRGHPQPPPPWPLVQRFRGFEFSKLVVGPWGDASEDLHQLLKLFAESRVENSARGMGYVSGEGELGQVMGDIRRCTSVTIVRAQALCLLERLSHMGPGARAAGERRKILQRLQERQRQQRQAYNVAQQSKGLSRVGRAFIPQH